MTDTEPALTASPLLRAALLTFDYIETNGPIGLTPNKAFKRYFVEWAAKAFDWPGFSLDQLYALNKVLNEQDYPPLPVLHDLPLGTKLARHYKGTVSLTKLAQTLKSKPASLWAHLAQHFLLGTDHSQYTRFGDHLAGDWGQFLRVINIETQQSTTTEQLSSIFLGNSNEAYDLYDSRMRSALYIHVLSPLCWLGLLEEHWIGKSFDRRDVFTQTPLWQAALSFAANDFIYICKMGYFKSHLNPI